MIIPTGFHIFRFETTNQLMWQICGRCWFVQNLNDWDSNWDKDLPWLTCLDKQCHLRSRKDWGSTMRIWNISIFGQVYLVADAGCDECGDVWRMFEKGQDVQETAYNFLLHLFIAWRADMSLNVVHGEVVLVIFVGTVVRFFIATVELSFYVVFSQDSLVSDDVTIWLLAMEELHFRHGSRHIQTT